MFGDRESTGSSFCALGQRLADVGRRLLHLLVHVAERLARLGDRGGRGADGLGEVRELGALGLEQPAGGALRGGERLQPGGRLAALDVHPALELVALVARAGRRLALGDELALEAGDPLGGRRGGAIVGRAHAALGLDRGADEH